MATASARSSVPDIHRIGPRSVLTRARPKYFGDVPPRKVGAALEEAETVLSLIGDIYDASLDPALWSDVLVKVRDFIGGSAAAIFSKDASAKSITVHYHCGRINQHYQQLYTDQYAKFDPFTSAQILADIEQPVSSGDVMAYDEFVETRFYKEWAQPQGLVDFLSAPLDKSATGAALFGVFRKEPHGRVDEVTRRRMRQIVPHIRRAVMVGRLIELRTTEAVTFANTLDGLNAGMFLVSESGRIVHANAGGQAMLADGNILRKAGHKLVATDARAAVALTELFAIAGRGDAAGQLKGAAVPLPDREGDCYVAHVMPMASDVRPGASAINAAVAAVFVRKAQFDVPCLPEAIAKHYGLTPSELRVLLAVVEIGGVAETAGELGVSEATVKTHLHRLFGKTGVGRQADLVKLVAGFSNPLVSCKAA